MKQTYLDAGPNTKPLANPAHAPTAHSREDTQYALTLYATTMQLTTEGPFNPFAGEAYRTLRRLHFHDLAENVWSKYILPDIQRK